MPPPSFTAKLIFLQVLDSCCSFFQLSRHFAILHILLVEGVWLCHVPAVGGDDRGRDQTTA